MKRTANVVFFASSIGMWRYQSLFEELKKDKRFNCCIVVIPFATYSETEREKDFKNLSTFFTKKKIDFIDAFHDTSKAIKWIKDFKPDILFYPQPYDKLYKNKLDNIYFRKSLFGYYPYGILTMQTFEYLNCDYQNIAWKIFLPSDFHVKDAIHNMINKGRNTVAVGEPNMDIYYGRPHKDKWKKQNKKKKRIIWSPHYTIVGNTLLFRDSFLWMNQIILDYAEKYKDYIQVAFKPHPRLKTELYRHPEWGKDKTDKYYKIWEEKENLQFEGGDFIDLFFTSDLLIHDSGSFLAEYLFTGKPAIFTSRHMEINCNTLNEFGKKCMDLHYKATNDQEAINMLNSIIFENQDPLRIKREEFRDTVLRRNNNKTVAELTYIEIIKGLGWKQ